MICFLVLLLRKTNLLLIKKTLLTLRNTFVMSQHDDQSAGRRVRNSEAGTASVSVADRWRPAAVNAEAETCTLPCSCTFPSCGVYFVIQRKEGGVSSLSGDQDTS